MAPRTASDTSFAKLTLPYPIFAVDFDPYNRGYLVVGGGGGESKTGVPNQISLLDVSNRAEIVVAAELALSREEDSVQSLASLATRDGLVTFAGINSSEAQQNAGNNEHFRSFEFAYPPRKKQKTEKASTEAAGQIRAVGKTKFFETSSAPRKETYQRLLRLSPPSSNGTSSKRIGAIATGLAKKSELIIFDATSQTPRRENIIAHILPSSEVADLDIIEVTPGEFSIIYATDSDLYEQTIKYDFAMKKAEKTPNSPRKIHVLSSAEDPENPLKQPKFRSVRFLNTDNVLALVNRAQKGGAELQIYHLYPTGPAFQTYEKALPSRIKQATGLDVCLLDEDEKGDAQVVIAVAGQDISVEVYTINFKGKSQTWSFFRKFLTMKDVHEHQMTKIALSFFHPPSTQTSNGEKAVVKTNQKFYLRMASVSYGNTVVVDSMPLKKLNENDPKSRYVLSHPSDERWLTMMWIGVGSLLVLVFAIIFQPFLEDLVAGKGLIASTQSSILSSTPRVPASAAQTISEVYTDAVESVSSLITEAVPTEIPGKSTLLDMIDEHLQPQKVASRLAPQHDHQHAHSHSHDHDHDHDHSHEHLEQHSHEHVEHANQPTPPNADETSGPSASKALVLRPADDSSPEGVTVEVHHDKDEFIKGDEKARHWHELAEHEKASWRQRLVKAGQWVEGQSEKVLMGVLFSEYSGAVGQLLN